MTLSKEGLAKINAEIDAQLGPWQWHEVRTDRKEEALKRFGNPPRPVYRHKKKHYDSDDVKITLGSKKMWLHRLMAWHFIGDIQGKDVHHIDGDHKNNDPANLCILTRQLHRNVHGR